MQKNIECEHPVIIVNPNLPLLVRSGFSRIVAKNVGMFNLSSSDIVSYKKTNKDGTFRIVETLNLSLLNIFGGYMLLPEYADNPLFTLLPNFISKEDLQIANVYDLYRRHYKKYYSVYNVDVNDLDEYYIISSDKDGKLITEPLFYAVPCGRCVFCRKHSTNVLKARCELEFASSKFVPYLCTLTFDNFNYPEDFSRETQTAYLQKFFKRLRRRMDYKGLNTNFRYFAVSEYGHLHHRFHYHIIFYNVDKALNLMHYNEKAKRTTSDFYTLLTEVWRYGMIDLRTIDINKGNTPISYVCKYLRKQNTSESTHHWKSIYLGKDTILRYRDNIIASFKDESFTVKNDLTGKPVKIPMYSFIKRIVSPNLVRSLPYNVRFTLYKSYILFEHLFNKKVISKGLSQPLTTKYLHYMPLYERLGFCDIEDKGHLYNVDICKSYLELKEDLCDTFALLDSYNLDVDKLYKEHDFYQDNIVVMNREFDIESAKFLLEKETNGYFSQEVDGQ